MNVEIYETVLWENFELETMNFVDRLLLYLQSIFHERSWCCCHCAGTFDDLEDLHRHSVENHPGNKVWDEPNALRPALSAILWIHTPSLIQMLICKHCDFFAAVEEEIVDHVEAHSNFADRWEFIASRRKKMLTFISAPWCIYSKRHVVTEFGRTPAFLSWLIFILGQPR